MLDQNKLAITFGTDPHPPKRGEIVMRTVTAIKRDRKGSFVRGVKVDKRPSLPTEHPFVRVRKARDLFYVCSTFPKRPKPQFDINDEARLELLREERMREKATLADDFHITEEAWPALNKLRAELIRKEIEGPLNPASEALLAYLEVAASRFVAEKAPLDTSRLDALEKLLDIENE